MKKLFNHSKRPYEEKNLDWDDIEDIDEAEEYGDEVTDYDAGNGEELVYTDEEAYGDETYYEDEEAHEEETYYEDGEVLEDEAYYEDGEALEDAAYYEDGEVLEDEPYYEEGEIPEDETYYEDEAYYEDEEVYDGEEEPYDEEYLEDEDFEEDEDEPLPWSAMEGKNVFRKLWYSFTHMSTLDRIVASTGVLVLILALATGAFMISTRTVNKQVSSFDTVGSQLAGVTVIGEQGLTAVADAELARIQAANAIEDEKKEEDEKKDYDENDYTKEVEVSLNMTSIEKDLKIKFVNGKTNKLIPNVPFSIKVKTPGGTEEVWTDDDMDGIIYKSNITPGSYSVTLQALSDTKYENYKLPESAKKVTVKKEIAYEKVEVADEIKDESEVNAKKEDTKENETTVESTLTDTVAWVESTKTVMNAVYTAVDKKTITDPLATAKNTRFMRTAETTVAMSDITLTLKEGETVTGSVAVAAPAEGAFTTKEYVSSKPEVATVDENGTVTAVAPGTTTITFTGTREYEAVSGSDPVKLTDTYKGSCTVTVVAAPPAKVDVTGLTLDKNTLKLEQGKTEKLTVTVTPSNATDPTFTFKSDAEKVATVAADGTVTAVGVGTAKITVASVSNPAMTAVCEVTVTAPAGTKSLKLDKTTLTAAVGVNTVINATVSNAVAGGDISGKLTVEVDKKEILDAVLGTTKDGVTPVTLTPKAKGTAVVTVKLDGELTAICTVTVSDLVMTIDKTTLSVLTNGKADLTVVIGSVNGTVKAESSDVNIAKAEVTTTKSAEQTTAKVTVTGVKAGSVTITVSNTENGLTTKKICTVTVVPGENKLTDAKKQQLYVLQTDGSYREATYADYYNNAISTFYLKTEGTIKYTGWQTLDGKLYFFDANGNKVTGEQVIQGAKYNFASDGSLSVGGGTFGIDVSKWNGTIDWTAVKNSGVNYVIIRCGYRGSSTGALIEDPKFASNIKGATAAGIKVGVYFFSQAVNNSEAVEEASMVLELIKKYTISYPVFLDVEASGGRADGIDKTTRTAVIKTFCETIQKAGYTAGVYANKSWLTNKIDTSQLSKYKIWLAQYAAAPTYTGRYDLWQYKSTGKVTGISGNVDMNISYLGY